MDFQCTLIQNGSENSKSGNTMGKKTTYKLNAIYNKKNYICGGKKRHGTVLCWLDTTERKTCIKIHNESWLVFKIVLLYSSRKN